MSSVVPRWGLATLGLVVGGFGPGTGVAGQDVMRELELTGGLSVEVYRGNLAAAAASVVDSTGEVAAAIGEIGGRGTLALLESDWRWLYLTFDGGLRQFAAGGFEIRNYAPREWVGRSAMTYSQQLGSWAVASARLEWRGRAVRDRPPMPLFLQPGFSIASASMRLELSQIDRVGFDLLADAEWANYSAQGLVAPLDLLDRESMGMEVGAAWGVSAMVRIFGALRWSEYPHQATFDPTDPVRRDRTVQTGFTWQIDAPITAELGVVGTINRSNSRRPEYDAIALRSVLSVPLPFDVGASLLAIITAKSYVCQRRSKRSQLWRLKMFHPAGGDEPQIVAASRRLRVRLG